MLKRSKDHEIDNTAGMIETSMRVKILVHVPVQATVEGIVTELKIA